MLLLLPRRPGACTLVLLLLTAATPVLTGPRGGAQSPPSTETTAGEVGAPAASWADAVARYEARDPAGALAAAARLAPDDLLRQGRTLAENWQQSRTDDVRRHLGEGAASTAYMDLAESNLRAFERAGNDETTAPFRATWRVAHLQLLLLSSAWHEVEAKARREDLDHLPPALQAEWHLARGIAVDTAARLSLGSSRVQQTPFGTTAMPRHLWIERNQQRAREHFEAAVAADGSHLEARLRLGRLLMEVGDMAAARPHLDRAASGRCREVVCGLAWLFLGDWHMAARAPEAARRAYVNASGVLAVRQSALIGLLGATQQARPAVALELTRQFDAEAMLGQLAAPDAWAQYLAGRPFGWTQVVETLRQEATR